MCCLIGLLVCLTATELATQQEGGGGAPGCVAGRRERGETLGQAALPWQVPCGPPFDWASPLVTLCEDLQTTWQPSTQPRVRTGLAGSPRRPACHPALPALPGSSSHSPA